VSRDITNIPDDQLTYQEYTAKYGPSGESLAEREQRLDDDEYLRQAELAHFRNKQIWTTLLILGAIVIGVWVGYGQLVSYSNGPSAGTQLSCALSGSQPTWFPFTGWECESGN
jgi:hypothetical protein